MEGTPLHIHLLVIDDDDVDRERVLRLLARSTIDVEAKEAATSACALSLLRTHEFDCIMLDNQLGDATGADLLPEIRRASLRACPIIMVTGAGNESLAVQALHEGAADYLTKYQLNADTLVRAIRRALDHHRLRVELDDLHARLEQRVEEQAAAIRQSERDLRAILDHTPTVIGYWDADLRNRFGNHAYRRWLGIESERLPGRHLGDVIGAPALARIQPHVDAVLRGESQFFEENFPSRDGVRHAQLSLHPDRADDGDVRGFYSTINDVTAIKRAQARAEELADFTETLFEHSPDGLGVFDEQVRCVKCNRELARLLGAAETDLIGLDFDRLMADEPLALVATARATLADGLSRRVEVDLRSRWGPRVFASCAWARVDREGHPHVLLAAQDSTEQRRAHDALVAARNAAEEATRAKSEFLANMSHEIRTPMNAVIGLSELALRQELPPKARNFVEKSHGAARALMGLLDDVLDYSKIEAGQLRFERVAIELEALIQRVVDLFAARIAHKGLDFVVELDPALPVRVLGDPLRLSQVINNLVGNAVKFTARGSIRLSVRPLPEPAPAPGMLRFSVRDSGIGIAPEQRHLLFEAFSQADSSITRRFGGTGLGLAISRRLVATMHGTIGVESVLGEGSEFWFSARLEPAPPAAPPAPLPAGLRLLAVGADGPIGPLLGGQLRAWGVDWQAVDEAAAPAHAGGFDAVVFDWAARADAPSFVERLRGAGGAALIALAPALGAAPAAEGASAPDIVLDKPLLPGALRAALAQLRHVAAPPPGGPVAQDQVLAGRRVLVVEDNEINRMVARLLLEQLGAEVFVAASGEEALARLEAVPGGGVDVVLMDMHMPSMDGLEATRRIRAAGTLATLPVIAMTAAVTAEDRRRCSEAGMVDIITKPVVLERLAQVVARWARGAGDPGAR